MFSQSRSKPPCHITLGPTLTPTLTCPLFGISDLDQVREVAPIFFDILAFTIALAELYRSLVGWVPPPKVEKYFGGELNLDYYP